jgi:phenol 2-monooxygenase
MVNSSFAATSVIRSDIDGSVDFVRREEGLVRMYVELNKGSSGKHLRREDITPELIIQMCQYLIRPYKVSHLTSPRLVKLIRLIFPLI